MNGRPERSGPITSRRHYEHNQQPHVVIRGLKIQSCAIRQTVHDAPDRTSLPRLVSSQSLPSRKSHLSRSRQSLRISGGHGFENRRSKFPLERQGKPRTFVDEVLAGMSPELAGRGIPNSGKSKVTHRSRRTPAGDVASPVMFVLSYPESRRGQSGVDQREATSGAAGGFLHR